MQNKKLRKEDVNHTQSLPASSPNVPWIPIIFSFAFTILTVIVVYVFYYSGIVVV